MPSFALIAEGITDQIVIERLIEALLEDAEDDPLIVNYLQPARDQTDKHHASHAGWALVLEHCEHNIADALATNAYVVVHIDTDDGDHPNFGVPLTDGGKARAYTDLIDGAKALLIGKMGEAATEEALSRIIFAIAVHATESWLLLIRFGQDRLLNTFEHLVRQLAKKKETLAKEAPAYRAFMERIKDKAIVAHLESNHSLGIFLRNLRDQTAAPPAP